MKILLIAQFGTSGGTREAFKRILKIHQEYDFETHVIIDHNSDDDIKEFIKQQGAACSRMKKRGRLFNNMIGSVLYEHLNYKTILKNWKPDLIVMSVGTAKFALYPFIRQYPLVYILHTIPLDLNTHIKFFFKIFSFFSGKNQWVCGVSDATIHSVVRNWGYARNKTTVLHNTFNEEHVNSDVEQEEKSEIIILTLGHIVWYKNPDIWLKVARQITKKFNHVKFVWLGDGTLFDKFEKESKGEPQISFPGFQKNVKKYYSQASIYFQPSITENHSLSVLDAMANGLPCVVSDVGGQPENIKEGIHGYLCEPDDSKLFVDRLTTLIENPKLRQRFGEQAKTRAYDNFNPSQYRKKLVELYKKVLAV